MPSSFKLKDLDVKDLMRTPRHRVLTITTTEEEHDRIMDLEWLRTDGKCLCTTCNRQYRHHPYWVEVPTLHLLCDGTWVKT